MTATRRQVAKYTRLIKYTLVRWRVLTLISALTLLSSAIAVLQPWPLKILVDFALGSSSVPPSIASFLVNLPFSVTTALMLTAAVASVGLFVLNTALDTGMTLAWSYYGERLSYDLAADLFHRLQHVSLVVHSRRTVGDSLSRLTGDVYCLYNLAQNLLIAPCQNLLTLATVGLVAWKLDPTLALITLLIAPIQVGATFFFSPRLKDRAEQNRKAQSSLLAFVHQTLTAIPLIQAFGTEERNKRHFRRLAADAAALSQRGVLLGNVFGVVSGFASVLSNAMVLYFGAERVLAGAISFGSVLVFLAYMGSIQGALSGLLGGYATLKSTDVNIDRVVEILDLDPGVREAPKAKPLPDALPRSGSHVRLENVTFGYEPDRPVLKDVTLEARPGEIIAIVGSTGAGKSTLVSLIPRFFDPWQGRVTVDGMDVRDVTVSSLRSKVAIALQESFLLPGTIAENIGYGRPEATREQVMAAAVAANADEFIRKLPDGYDTLIAERGATLSGGEKQRIAIARAILKDAPILILDEPTSALDAKTEALMLEALERLMIGRTGFVIAHRLSTIRNADRIVVIEGGQVVETGTHEQLLAGSGHYHRFHSLQFASTGVHS
jgi:ABC-type multidrug transport system fused ATPase/permease subunit